MLVFLSSKLFNYVLIKYIKLALMRVKHFPICFLKINFPTFSISHPSFTALVSLDGTCRKWFNLISPSHGNFPFGSRGLRSQTSVGVLLVLSLLLVLVLVLGHILYQY